MIGVDVVGPVAFLATGVPWAVQVWRGDLRRLGWLARRQESAPIRALTRSFPALCAGTAFVAVASLLDAVVGLPDAAYTVFGLVYAAALCVWVAVALYNRPRFAVPPAFRDDPGLVAERRARRGTPP